MSDAPKPGLHKNVPAEDYHGWSAASSHALILLSQKTPAHARHYLDSCGGESTEAQQIGTLTHLAILEPKKFDAGVVAAPVCDRRTKAGKQEWEAFQLASSDKWAIQPTDYSKILAMRNAAYAHPTANELLTSKGLSETSVVWNESGVLCKARQDRITTLGTWGVILDVKTARDASRRAFERAIFQYGYHIQGAHYLSGVASAIPLNAGASRRYFFIVVENVEPYCVAVYELDEYALEEGEIQRQKSLRTWKECTESGVWPGYGNGAEVCGIPAWATKAYADSSE